MKEKFTLNTIINIASTSKTAVRVSVNSVVKTGLISLDNDVNNFILFRINNPQIKKPTLTLRNLISHCTGIIDRQEIDLPEYHYDQDYLIKLRWLIENYLSKMVYTIQIKL